MSVTYHDAFLKDFVNAGIETRAYAEIDLIDTFSDAWRDRMVVYQAYVIVCLENQADADDLFSVKLKEYRKEFDRVLAQATVATPDAEGIIGPVTTIPLERG